MKHNILIGDKFGRLTVIGFTKGRNNSTKIICKCECGKEKVYEPSNLVKEKSKSCGCLQKEIVRKCLSKKNEYTFVDGYVVGKTSNGTEFFFDTEDYEKVSQFCWYQQKNGYIMTDSPSIGRISLHRFLMNPPTDMVVDHINHNRTDNRRNNLRICTAAVNARNRSIPPKGITTKISGRKTYYVVQIKGKYGGCFKTYEEAKIVRDKIWGNGYD